MRQILVTSALPYANGPIHLGHLVEYIQTDIWVRAMQSMGHKVTYICADDAHGTAIMLKAEENGISPEAQIANVQAEHERDFAGFLINFDNYYSTHSDENRYYSSKIYNKLKENGRIAVRPVEQLYDPEKQLFLADRFVKGICPKCNTADQYGDNCDHCGATYPATDLKSPYSTLSGATPIIKSSEHYFFTLSEFTEFLQDWTTTQDRLQPAIANKLQEWLTAGLRDWDISRDAPYFGFKIPDTDNKYFYVWLDAPIGYIASFANLCQRRDDLNVADYWHAIDSEGKPNSTELYHFIGKDIINFHALFWPAMLHDAGYRTPTGVFAHGYLTVNGDKMSKSRGTFIKAETYLNHLRPECLRYYFASKLTPAIEDINLDFDDFMQKVNSDLVGKVVNIASRCAGFIKKKFDNQLAATNSEPELLNGVIAAGDDIMQAYEARDFNRAMRLIMAQADKANEYIDTQKPWQLNKEDGKEANVQNVCSVGINLFRQLIIYLAPVLPELSKQAAEFLNVDAQSGLKFAARHNLLLEHKINSFKPLLQRVEQSQIDAVIADSQQSLQSTTPSSKAPTKQASTQTTSNQDVFATSSEDGIIDIQHFGKVDMRVAKIIEADYVEGADKLLQLVLDIGADKTISVFSGIRQYYSPEALLHRKVIALINLKPRKMKFGVSEGMILAASNADGVYLIHPDNGAFSGDKVS